MKFHLLNVFTTASAASGNQLAIVLPDGDLETSSMVAITKNFNFSETVFLRHDTLRIFTPVDELPFAGHPTVGSAWLAGKLSGKKEFSLRAPLGELKMSAAANSATVVFPGTPVIRDHKQDLAKLMPTYGLTLEEVDCAGVKNVNTGPEFLLVPVTSHAALKALTVPVNHPLRTYFVYEHDAQNFSVRMFGHREDAATGSAACALAGYLRDFRQRSTGALSISQGTEMGRPSEVKIVWDARQIVLAGKVSEWGRGDL